MMAAEHLEAECVRLRRENAALREECAEYRRRFDAGGVDDRPIAPVRLRGVRLTMTQSCWLALFMAGKPVSRAALIGARPRPRARVDDLAQNGKIVDVHLTNLRKKLAAVGVVLRLHQWGEGRWFIDRDGIAVLDGLREGAIA